MPNERKFPEQKYQIGDNVWFFDNGKIFRGVVLGVRNINIDTNEYLIEGKNMFATWLCDNYLYADKKNLLIAIRDYIVEEERR